MPSIKPFNGIIYNSPKIRDPASVVAPPYDVIPTFLQNELYHRSPYNIVRLTLGKTKDDDNISSNRYTRAKDFLESWIRARALTQDKKKSLYVYSQVYKEDKKYIERIGFVGLMRLSTGKRKNVLPHENTLLAPKLDRLSLIRSVKANLELIFVLYEDKNHNVLNILKKTCNKKRPFIDIELDGVRHRMWRLDDSHLIERIQRLMRPKDIFIADGHHRYEVAVQYCIEIQNENLPKEIKKNAKYIMSYFVELNDEILTILPTHRLIKDIGILKREDITKRLSKFFDIKKVSSIDILISKLRALKNRCAFGLYVGKGSFYILGLKDPRISDRLIKNNSKDWKRLDVTILHLFILEYVLGIRDDEDNIAFVKDTTEVVNLVDRGKYNIAFFLNPTKVSQVKRIAKLEEKMPRKATYFYPKPLSGLLINKL